MLVFVITIPPEYFTLFAQDMVSTLTFWRRRQSRGISNTSIQSTNSNTEINVAGNPFDDAKAAGYEQDPNLRRFKIEV